MNGQINSKIITYTDKCGFMIHFCDIYVISDFFRSSVLIHLHETTCCNIVIHQLYKMSFLFFTANQNIANASEILRIIKYQRNVFNFFPIYFFLMLKFLGSSQNLQYLSISWDQVGNLQLQLPEREGPECTKLRPKQVQRLLFSSNPNCFLRLCFVKSCV